MVHDDSTGVGPVSVPPCPEELRRQADQRLHTAELDIQRSDEAVDELTRTLSDFRALWEKNGFGDDLVKIFKAPTRGRA
ncbi:hypothetical protein SEA_RASPUTIA_80 [Microbacterium phage Rasputia]|nr:hypothetical protein SEA_RASPUTIA_80 [Microbacterium phage Rasputia]